VEVLVMEQERYRWRFWYWIRNGINGDTGAGKIQREVLVEAGMAQIKITVPVARY
jgi:hypothetical protein